MRVLAFNHFFEQDLDALSDRLLATDDLVVVPYQRLLRIARRHFPDRAFVGVEPAMSGAFDAEWRAYTKAATSFADWLARAHAPNVFVVPTDAIFYLRPVIARFAALGLPTVVVQKETTISPMVMDEHAANVRRAVPFMSAHMTVCSDRQCEFWVRAGSDPERITVTGQPRFDVYASPAPKRAGVARLLYLSYDDTAYLPSDTGLAYEGSWRELRLETERCLDALSNIWQIVAKQHPQQRPGDTALGANVTVAPRDADTRRLILEADVVVGFQTTALFEAAAAGKAVVYAAWGPVYERALPMLIPFHEYGFVHHATSPVQLSDALSDPSAARPRDGSDVNAAVVEHIGVVDGRAAERALAVVRANARPTPPAGAISHGLLARAVLAAIGAPLAGAAAMATRAARPSVAGALQRRSLHWRQEAGELSRVVRRRREVARTPRH